MLDRVYWKYTTCWTGCTGSILRVGQGVLEVYSVLNRVYWKFTTCWTGCTGSILRVEQGVLEIYSVVLDRVDQKVVCAPRLGGRVHVECRCRV